MGLAIPVTRGTTEVELVKLEDAIRIQVYQDVIFLN
jgi:hypothetical protein